MPRFIPLIAAFFAYTAPVLAQSTTTVNNPTATIDSGTLVGTATSVTSSLFRVEKFLGIPFAAPPVRFKPPKAPAKWDSVYNASTYKPACIQQWDYPEDTRKLQMEWMQGVGPPAGESEDCLYLDVYTPRGGSKGKSVLFWIFGGGFSYGTGSLAEYDGSSFAAHHDVVVVTPNYRTNVFGFPGSPQIPENERNLGLLDQRMALEWVQRNIEAFGGDPKKVTLFGESAGAGSIDALITAPPDPVPFRAAILQSGFRSLSPCSADSGFSWVKLSREAGCPHDTGLECVQKLDVDKLKDIVERAALPFDADCDGITVKRTARTDRIKSANDSSLIARVPMMIGSNANEGSVYVIGQNSTEEFLKKVLEIHFPNGVPEDAVKNFLEIYPLGEPGMETEQERLDRILTEAMGQCPIKVLAEESKEAGIDTYRYYFDAGFPNSDLFNGSGAYHSAEIQMVFGTYNQTGATETQMEVSRAMQKAWADFAKDPSKGPGWGMVPEVGVFGGGIRAGDRPGKAVFALAGEDLDKRCVVYDNWW
ncbi:cholinesterase [Polyplosphaeria fusca]|uniref:Carboxylic ester hydrolase n=1 Tax=Polyplosphaeria fusca TaxID=682080 RepID=A0A9P4QWV2_9PLEO|nr:cholinesterase [Polyplosphaeria fusca]